MVYQRKETKEKCLPEAILHRLKEGNARFVDGTSTQLHENISRVKELSGGQAPDVVVVTCSDSRVAPEIVFDQGLGDIFTIRTAGNLIGHFEEGSIEFAVEYCKSSLIVVMGHTSCAAVAAMLDQVPHTHFRGHVASIVNCLKSKKGVQAAIKSGGVNLMYNVIRANVVDGVEKLRRSTPILRKGYERGEIDIVGAIYQIETGRVFFLKI